MVVHERRGRLEPMIWDPVAGTEVDGDGDLAGREVGVAHTRRHHLDLDLARPRRGDLDVVVDLEILIYAVQDSCGDHVFPLDR